MPVLSARERAHLPSHAFAYVDSAGRKRLPIHDESHVRNALARFDQVVFETDEAREQARQRLLRAAKRYGIVPVGFVHGQLRKERTRGETGRDPARLPRGTVTFLMTDIEGSTRLLRALGPRYTPILRRVRSLIRSAVKRSRGHEVDARADEYFAAFHEPADALAAALSLQRELATRRWPAGAVVSVRVGLHRGRTTVTESGYVGIAVHTVARVCSAGHGGQILASSAARLALADAGSTFRDLGRYALDGLTEAEALFQVMAPDLPARFPRLRVPKAPRA